MSERAGTPALPEDLIDVDEVVSAYYDREPTEPVVFGTSGHRGSSLDGAFNEGHIASITAASSTAVSTVTTASSISAATRTPCQSPRSERPSRSSRPPASTSASTPGTATRRHRRSRSRSFAPTALAQMPVSASRARGSLMALSSRPRTTLRATAASNIIRRPAARPTRMPRPRSRPARTNS